MMQIPCPWCGVCDEDEYRYGGESHVTRPGLDATDEAWSNYLFNKDNTKGAHYKRWLHVFGCGHWFNMVRHTVTHEVIAVYQMGEPKPHVNGGAQ